MLGTQMAAIELVATWGQKFRNMGHERCRVQATMFEEGLLAMWEDRREVRNKMPLWKWGILPPMGKACLAWYNSYIFLMLCDQMIASPTILWSHLCCAGIALRPYSTYRSHTR